MCALRLGPGAEGVMPGRHPGCASQEVRRRELYHKQQWHYLMTINHIHKAPAQGQQASGGQQHRAAAAQHQADDAELVAIDATYVGNISRYVNHMCGSAANCCVQAVCRGGWRLLHRCTATLLCDVPVGM